MKQLVMEFGNQRWAQGRDSYRPPAETINPRLYEAAAIPDDTTAKAFVEEHHYSRSFPAAVFRVGLYRAGRLVGVAVYSQPVNTLTLPKWAGPGAVGTELGRFVLLDEVPGNGETWFLSRARKILRRARPEFEYVVSFADPYPRRALDGTVVMPGHVGTIYQAFSAKYCGQAARNTIYIAPDGTTIGKRTLSKVRGGESGAEYAYEKLLRAGAPARHPDEPGHDYITRVLQSDVLRRRRHPGNHVFLFRLRGPIEAGKPYPKKEAA